VQILQNTLAIRPETATVGRLGCSQGGVVMSPTAHIGVLLYPSCGPGAIVRAARTALKWSQAELGRRCGYSASQVSRWETGRLPLRDVNLLRTLADVLNLPPTVLGLGEPARRGTRPTTGTGPRVGRVTTPLPEEDDPVRRRTFLQLTALTGTTLALP
jgi:transcriptional regulator with XRE-family HTH domain